jgi:uncharacterized membrane protein
MRDSSDQVEARVTISRPVAEVFAFYRDLRNLPQFLGDVLTVDQLDPVTYRWAIQGPLGVKLRSTVRVTQEQTNELLAYETLGVPGLQGSWMVHFGPGPVGGSTEVVERLRVPMGGFGRSALAMVGKPPSEEVASNLHRLKQLLETGVVTDTAHAVPGKFA